MKEIILKSFTDTLKEVQELKNVIDKEKSTKEGLKNSLEQSRKLLFSNYSSLNIFEESVTNYVTVGHRGGLLSEKGKKLISKTEAKLIYSQLLNIINTEIEKNAIKPIESLFLENQVYHLGLVFKLASIDEDVEVLNNDLNIDTLSNSHLLKNLNIFVNAIIKYIQDILLYNIFLIFDTPKIEYKYEMVIKTDYKKEYIDKWLNYNVRLSELRRYKRIDHWSEFFELKLDFETIEKLENYQKELFDNGINFNVNSEIDDINELKDTDKKAAIENNIRIIEAFFNGDVTKTTIKRLKNILSFTKPKEVLVAYDNILKDKLILSEYLIFQDGISGYSHNFVAAFFINYLASLKEFKLKLSRDDTKNIKKEKTIKHKHKTQPKYQSFTYINNLTGQSNLTGLKESLINRELIANDTDLKDFRKIFSGEAIDKPITWTGNISELSYFIKQMHNVLKLVQDLKQQQWEVTNMCFVKIDGSQFGRYKLKGQKRPTTFKNIDLALKTLQ